MQSGTNQRNENNTTATTTTSGSGSALTTPRNTQGSLQKKWVEQQYTILLHTHMRCWFLTNIGNKWLSSWNELIKSSNNVHWRLTQPFLSQIARALLLLLGGAWPEVYNWIKTKFTLEACQPNSTTCAVNNLWAALASALMEQLQHGHSRRKNSRICAPFDLSIRDPNRWKRTWQGSTRQHSCVMGAPTTLVKLPGDPLR
jgi:hypothetical protein